MIRNLKIILTASIETEGGHVPIRIPEIHALTLIKIDTQGFRSPEYPVELIDSETGLPFYVSRKTNERIRKVAKELEEEMDRDVIQSYGSDLFEIMIKEGVEYIMTKEISPMYPSIEVESEEIARKSGGRWSGTGKTLKDYL